MSERSLVRHPPCLHWLSPDRDHEDYNEDGDLGDDDDDDDEVVVDNNNKTQEVAVNGNAAARPQNFQFIPAPKEVEAALEGVKEDAR